MLSAFATGSSSRDVSSSFLLGHVANQVDGCCGIWWKMMEQGEQLYQSYETHFPQKSKHEMITHDNSEIGSTMSHGSCGLLQLHDTPLCFGTQQIINQVCHIAQDIFSEALLETGKNRLVKLCSTWPLEFNLRCGVCLKHLETSWNMTATSMAISSSFIPGIFEIFWGSDFWRHLRIARFLVSQKPHFFISLEAQTATCLARRSPALGFRTMKLARWHHSWWRDSRHSWKLFTSHISHKSIQTM